MSSADAGKTRAAAAAIAHLDGDAVLGVGTGSTVNHFIDALAGALLKPRGAVSSSEASTRRLRAHGIEVLELAEVDALSVYVDGADEATRHRQLIKGGGGALTREKVLAAAARRFICIADRSKLVALLGRFPLPVEVIPMARSFVARRLVAAGGQPVWRENFLTDNGNPILDVHGLDLTDPSRVECELNQIAGVVSVGLFAARPADLLLIGDAEGVETI